jgi:hypothetical protein
VKTFQRVADCQLFSRAHQNWFVAGVLLQAGNFIEQTEHGLADLFFGAVQLQSDQFRPRDWC